MTSARSRVALSTIALVLCAAVVRAQEPTSAVFAEPAAMGEAVERARPLAADDGENPENGFYPESSRLPAGSGLAVGPGYRRWLFGDRALVDTSAALSWRLYRMARASIELPRLAGNRVSVGSDARWQDLTQVRYFGTGPASTASARSEYRLRTANVTLFAAVRPVPWLSVRGLVGRLGGPALEAPSGSFRSDSPDTRLAFPGEPAFAHPDQPAFVHGEVSVVADTRDHRGHPTRGGVYRAGWSRYDDRAARTFDFTRREIEAAHFLPLAGSRAVVAVRGWLVASDTGAGRSVPFYWLPSLGGATTLRSFATSRFHDRHLALVNAEARVAVWAHLDVAVFLDAGNVAPRPGDLNLGRRSVGAGLRVHDGRTTLVRLDAAHGREGWRILLRAADPLRLTRLDRRTAAVPFDP